MKILVTGSRLWTDRALIKEALIACTPTIVVHGGYVGADMIANAVAQGDLHIAKVRIIQPDHLFARQHTPAEPIDQCLAFPLPKSRGTWDMITRCVNAGIPVEVFGNADDDTRYRTLVRKFATR